MAEALTGAPTHAKETVLKILERLTQRLDRAERDRDLAIGRYRELQSRYEQLEEELSKKRGELRELLRQDTRLAAQQTETAGTRPGLAEQAASPAGVSLTVIVEREGEERSNSGSAGSADTKSTSSLPPTPKLELTTARTPTESSVPPQAVSPRKELKGINDELSAESESKSEHLNNKPKVGKQTQTQTGKTLF